MRSRYAQPSVQVILGLSLAAPVAYVAHRTGSLSISGAVAATAVGASAFTCGGWPGVRTLLAFFISSSLISHLPLERRRARPYRTARQVLANGGIAAIAWCLHRRWPEEPWRRAAEGALAAAAADTWATEVGQRWGGTPRLITSWSLTSPGESGGVTLLGSAAAIAGAGMVALSASPRIVAGWRFWSPVLAGVMGSCADSVLGATLQARFRCSVCGLRTEHRIHCDAPGSILSGHAWMTNDSVNLLATVTGALVGLSSGMYLRTTRN